MQQTVIPPDRYSGLSRSSSGHFRTITVTALTLFALAGLIVGFSAGAVRLPKKTTPVAAGTPQRQPTLTAQHDKTTTPTPAPTPTITPLGCPQMTESSYVQTADGTQYIVTAQARNNPNSCGGGSPIKAKGITFKLWLVKLISSNQSYQIDNIRLRQVDTLADPLPGKIDGKDHPEVVGALNFASSTPQTHLSDDKGQFTWQYTLSSSLKKGDYSLVVLTDWDGKYANWSWNSIKVE